MKCPQQIEITVNSRTINNKPLFKSIIIVSLCVLLLLNLDIYADNPDINTKAGAQI